MVKQTINRTELTVNQPNVRTDTGIVFTPGVFPEKDNQPNEEWEESSEDSVAKYLQEKVKSVARYNKKRKVNSYKSNVVVDSDEDADSLSITIPVGKPPMTFTTTVIPAATEFSDRTPTNTKRADEFSTVRSNDTRRAEGFSTVTPTDKTPTENVSADQPNDEKSESFNSDEVDEYFEKAKERSIQILARCNQVDNKEPYEFTVVVIDEIRSTY